VAADERIPIAHERDIVAARQRGRELAAERGFSTRDQTLIATAISEVARNIVVYAKEGHVAHPPIDADDGRRGIVVTAVDQGPGIANVELAMRDGYSTGKSLGLGLPGARRLMDEFEIETAVGKGTTVRMRKWVK
jgi:serine/threonine-protein kinase RsbT